MEDDDLYSMSQHAHVGGRSGTCIYAPSFLCWEILVMLTCMITVITVKKASHATDQAGGRRLPRQLGSRFCSWSV